MVQQTAGGGNEKIHALDQLVRLGLSVRPTHHNAKRLRVVLEEITGNTCEKPNGRNEIIARNA